MNEPINYQSVADGWNCVYTIPGRQGDVLLTMSETSAKADFRAVDWSALVYSAAGKLPEGDSWENHIMASHSMYGTTSYFSYGVFPQNSTFNLVVNPTDLNASITGYVKAFKISKFGPEAGVAKGSSIMKLYNYAKANKGLIVDQPVLYGYMPLDTDVAFNKSAVWDCVYRFEGKKGDGLFVTVNSNVGADVVALDGLGISYLSGIQAPAGDSWDKPIIANSSMANTMQYSTYYTFTADQPVYFVICSTDFNAVMNGHIKVSRISGFGPGAGIAKGISVAEWLAYIQANNKI